MNIDPAPAPAGHQSEDANANGRVKKSKRMSTGRRSSIRLTTPMGQNKQDVLTLNPPQASRSSNTQTRILQQYLQNIADYGADLEKERVFWLEHSARQRNRMKAAHNRIVIGKVEDPYARQRAKEEVLEEMSRTAPRLTLNRLLNSYYGIYGEHREHREREVKQLEEDVCKLQQMATAEVFIYLSYHLKIILVQLRGTEILRDAVDVLEQRSRDIKIKEVGFEFVYI
ncbi:hypothetical protein WR25_08411 isoform F [Diploscapter pachys]|uniref:Uncharacterized protein n=1 Tax=Diploscapter pachys TaxID=2018661 RepID=A0A2A2KTQ7_9BILA|nr:hypothetical protein WR25_08411 isoform F [Diploscapter pachys]